VSTDSTTTPDQHWNPFTQLTHSRREFLRNVGIAGVGSLAVTAWVRPSPSPQKGQLAGYGGSLPAIVVVDFLLNKEKVHLELDPRVTLLDALRENLKLYGTKKGCDRGQCGACTVLVNGRRVNSCLTLAGLCHGAEITTIEGLADGDKLHPMQEAFIKHDAYQCGYCTPGQICSAVGLLHEGHAHTEADIHELMSGNICRCGTYNNIVAAIQEVQADGGHFKAHKPAEKS
jgi:xanthine dehydrogenase YagT iron-sulfur-binding subunit